MLRSRSLVLITVMLALLIAGFVALLGLFPRDVAAQGAPTTARGAFLVLVGNDTAAVDRFVSSPTRLQGTVTLKAGPRVEYDVAYDADITVRSFTARVFGPSAPADAAPLQIVTMAFHDDSVFMEQNGMRRTVAGKTGTIPGVGNGVAMNELLTRRAARSGGTADIPYLAGANVVPATVRPLGTDSALVTIAGQVQRVGVDATGRLLGGSVAGLARIVRVDGDAAAKITLARPDYSAPAGAPYTAEEVTLTGPGGITLGGTLTLPKGVSGKVPAVVTITGSGQEDRDEYIPVAGGYRPFRQIADTLGRRGIATLRLDDRMVGASGGTIGTSADYADDIRAAVAYLRTRREIDGARIGLVGHSEGGLIAPMVAATDASLKGIVLMAGPAYTGDRIIRFQLRNLTDKNDAIPAAKKDSAFQASYDAFAKGAASDVWTRFFLTYDPLVTARKVKVPTLILQGATDQQVTPEQAKLLLDAIKAGGNKDVTMQVVTDRNHLFVPDTDGNPANYVKLPSAKVSPEVLGSLADWLVARLGAPTSTP
jgi:dienelactone hydrolase